MNKYQGYKVDNAVIMAAGTSSRFAPLSYEKPKGLLNVKGEILIERQIRQLHEAGITDITIVTGYLKEQFFYLKDKFGVDIVINEDYAIYNNTSSLIRVADRIKNTYVCSSDNYFTANPFEPFVNKAFYSAVFIPGESDEWGLECKADPDNPENELITGISHSPRDMWCMMGHVFFSEEFSNIFVPLLKTEYQHAETREHLWESLYEKHINILPMYIRKYETGIIMEFDSLNELKAFDNMYVNNSGSKILELICGKLDCCEADLEDIKALSKKPDDLSFTFTLRENKYIYQHRTAEVHPY